MTGPNNTILTILLLIIPLSTLVVWRRGQRKLTQPPRLGETIPFISNTWQFMTNKRLFIARVRKALEVSPVVRCRLGPMDVHLVTGASNVSALFRSSFTSDPWIVRILQHSAGYTPTDVAKFSKDVSGGSSLPRNESAGVPPPERRIWYAMHRAYDENMLGSGPVMAFATSFQAFFSQHLAKFPACEWVEDVRIFDFFKQNMTVAATQAVLGPRMIDVNPGFVEAFWQYEKAVEPLAFGLPSWLHRRGVRARNRLRAMCLKWYEIADQEFDWENLGPHHDADWEPIFGSRISKGLARWGKSFEFSAESMGAVYSLFLFGLHANTIPICTWVIMHLIMNPDLFRDIKEEISKAEVTDSPTGQSLNYQKLASLPLLQSVYTETLRLHVGVLITRKSTESITLGEYTFPEGSVFQAPTAVSHLDESIWGTPNHPASEFWGYRHVKVVETRDNKGDITKSLSFSLTGRTGSFFPYGGGLSMCAGRNFAKPEVLLAVAMVVSRFEIEFMEWQKFDGSWSKQPASDDMEYANSVAAPPDRDMKVRWRRTC